MMPSRGRLQDLYLEINSCHICPDMDPDKALRRIDAVEPSLDTMIVSQALAEGQLRRTGVNFFTAQGQLGNTGRNLERFLNLFDRTVYPPLDVRLESGVVIPMAVPPLVSVYNTELAQCFPGKRRDGSDRPPRAAEVATCIEQGFLEREIGLINPKLILLMGDRSRRGFYRHLLGEMRRDTLHVHLENVVRSGRIPSAVLGGRKVFLLPIQHASGANPNFHAMLENASLTSLIRELLDVG